MTRMTGSVPDARTTRRPLLAELLAAVLDGARDTRIRQRLSGLESHIPQDLRHRIESTADLAHRLILLLDNCQDLQGGNESVAGRAMIQEDNMAGLLAAEIKPFLPHVFEHIAVSDGGARKRKAEVLRDSVRGRGST